MRYRSKNPLEKSKRRTEKRANKEPYYGIAPTKEQVEYDMERGTSFVGYLMDHGTNDDDDEGEQRRQGTGDSGGGPDDTLLGDMLTTPESRAAYATRTTISTALLQMGLPIDSYVGIRTHEHALNRLFRFGGCTGVIVSHEGGLYLGLHSRHQVRARSIGLPFALPSLPVSPKDRRRGLLRHGLRARDRSAALARGGWRASPDLHPSSAAPARGGHPNAPMPGYRTCHLWMWRLSRGARWWRGTSSSWGPSHLPATIRLPFPWDSIPLKDFFQA